MIVLGVKLITEITELKTEKILTEYRITEKIENSVIITECTEVNRCDFSYTDSNNRITNCIPELPNF